MKKHFFLISLLLVLSTFTIYSQVKDHDFINFDDNLYIIDNYHINTGISIKNIIWAFTNYHAGNWHPLTWISHSLDIELFGMDPGSHHLSSVFLHILNTLLLFTVLKMMTGNLWQSAFVSALFALHPLHVESVAWASEKKDLLCAFFWFLTILIYINYVKNNNHAIYFIAVLSFVLGLLSKPMIVTLPLILIFLDYYIFKRSKDFRLLILEKIPFFIFSFLSIIITFFAQKSFNAVASLNKIPFNDRMSNALISFIDYIYKTILPFNLSIFYPYYLNISIKKISFYIIILSLITFFAIKSLKKCSYIFVGWLWYIITLMPVIGIVQVGSQSMADRYTYIPLIGIFIAVTFAVTEFMAKLKYKDIYLTISALFIILAVMSISQIQIQYWQNSITLFEHAIAVTPNNFLAHNNLGFALEKMQNKTKDALYHYNQAIKINVNYVDAYNNKGALLERQGNYKEAYETFKKALLIDSNNALVHNNMGNVLKHYGNLKGALRHYNQAIKINFDFAEAHNNLGTIFAENNNLKEALYHFQQSLKSNPNLFKTYANIANVLSKQGNLKEAFYYYQEALKRSPDNFEIYYNMGNAWMNNGDLYNASIYFKKSLKVNPSCTECYNNLGIILAQGGEIKEAIEYFKKALKINPDYIDARSNFKKAFNMLK